jgi:hypothetical protein
VGVGPHRTVSGCVSIPLFNFKVVGVGPHRTVSGCVSIPLFNVKVVGVGPHRTVSGCVSIPLFNVNVKVVGVGPHRPKARSRSGLWNPSFLKTAASQVGMAVFQKPA